MKRLADCYNRLSDRSRHILLHFANGIITMIIFFIMSWVCQNSITNAILYTFCIAYFVGIPSCALIIAIAERIRKKKNSTPKE